MGKTHKGKHTPQLRARQTRSSKGRLLTSTSPADSTALLTSQLRALGLYAADTLGDGNCLFRALSDQLTGSPSSHLTLRQRICDHIEQHKERYAPFVEDERGLETHVGCMREQGTYGGHMELSAFAHMEKRDVKVVQPGLVYVIEWRAFAGSPKVPAKSYNYHHYEADEEEDDDGEDDHGHKHIKDKDPPEGDTIYVAYHDWEHFSSIRNLRGPHTGLPCVRETPPPVASTSSSPAPSPSPAPSSKPNSKGKPAKKKVTLKLGSGASTPVPTPTPSPAPDPSTIPLPSSRAASPPLFPPTTLAAPHPLRTSYLPNDAPPSPLSPLPMSPSPHPPPLSQHLPPPTHPQQTQTQPQPLTHAPSPKRALDTADDDSEASSSGSVKRSRRSHPSSGDVLPTLGMDVEIEAEAEYADGETSTPALSPPSSSSGSGSGSQSQDIATPPSSESDEFSPEPSPPPPPPPPPAPAPEREKPMTRRQRKALGLPKLRDVDLAAKIGGSGTGRIVIPGGRFKKGVRSGGGGGGEDEGEGEEGEGEWVRNGAGRVDVRGFRELKI
ncbi:hypothetical protein DXG01_001193 [Tephrocybe rancida]|nr:hypothetical protein DXG01_001193 [Tephrocybe rancida]